MSRWITRILLGALSCSITGTVLGKTMVVINKTNTDLFCSVKCEQGASNMVGENYRIGPHGGEMRDMVSVTSDVKRASKRTCHVTVFRSQEEDAKAIASIDMRKSVAKCRVTKIRGVHGKKMHCKVRNGRDALLAAGVFAAAAAGKVYITLKGGD